MLLCKIEKTRQKLRQAIDSGKTFTDGDVIELSQQLDEYLVEIQKKKLIKKAMTEISDNLV
ncbi:aspartyl-phosphate phosphatase Spo0E family protein [Paenibacillus profundus]|uniref:Aspartyl-phosphate phosphatase Spo0E family protein n=1 Tax=Paenibacillus profundus TaxID=1173085 RepID=A0ABS8YNN7_9BACL|nr:aspartyl-phosphate phosphatase Spo0E family protein [Paenibacillus profundus]